MEFIDTHTHLYLPEFDSDRDEMIQRALSAGVKKMLLPNIDRSSIKPMQELVNRYPENCFPMMGLHPGSVSEDFETNLKEILVRLENDKYVAIGEIGIDLYWDKSFRNEQEEAFRMQLRWGKERKLPVVIHIRNSFDEVFKVLETEWAPGIQGVFHCFSGNLIHARKAMEMGFLLGIGGVVSFKNSGLQQVVKEVPEDYLLLETDAPYLAPVPYRGKRNESAYLPLIANHLAELKGLSSEYIASVTTENATRIFFPEN